MIFPTVRLKFQKIIFIALTITMTSCSKDKYKEVTTDVTDFKQIFENFWVEMNFRYVYWDIDKTNWDSVYTVYHEKFYALKNTDADRRKSVGYFRQMTKSLIDCHYSITFNQAPLNDSIINPQYIQKSVRSNFHQPYNYSPGVIPYLDKNYLFSKGTIVNNTSLITVTTGTINQKILYFNTNFFSLNQSINKGDQQIKNAVNYFFSKLNTSSNLRGIILDLRNNNGGDIADLNLFVGKFVQKNTLFGYTRNKSGVGKFDYLPWVDARVIHDPAYQNPYQVVVLADNFTASLSETIILALKADGRCTLVGETTYGATGPLADSNIFNSGPFQIGTFMNVETSSVEFKTLNNEVIESKGINPDTIIPFNISQLSKGKDPQLETAINILKN
jgi:hypothetical protein